MDYLDTIFLQPSRNDFTSPYRPSVFLCCVLIFWTIIAMVSEVIIPELAFAFTLTTYGPTIHFGVQSIIQSVRGSHTEPDRVKSNAKHSVILVLLWLFSIAAHFFFWWSEKSGWAGLFLNGLYLGSQPALIMLYIAVRYVLHRRARERRGIQLPDEEEASTGEVETLPTEAPGPSSSGEVVQSSEVPLVVFDTYQPSIQLLVLSILLTAFTAVTDILRNDMWFQIIAAVQTHIPTTLLHLYILSCIVRRRTQMPQDLSATAGFSFEITLGWIWTRLFIVAIHSLPLYHAWFMPGVAEAVLMLYFCIRYAHSLSNASAQQYKRIHSRTLSDEAVTTEPSPTSADADIPETVETPALDVYHPSIFILILGIFLSATCIYIEAPKEPAIGAPMSVLVYTPTIVVYTSFIVQWWRYTYADLKKYEKATERSIQLAAIWVLTHAFYLFVWPVSQYLKAKVMNPYVRGAAVGVAVYISARYILDRKLKARRDRMIALPPDDTDPASIRTPGPESVTNGA